MGLGVFLKHICVQNPALQGDNGTVGASHARQDGWEVMLVEHSGSRCDGSPLSRPSTNHQTRYKQHSTQKTSFSLSTGYLSGGAWCSGSILAFDINLSSHDPGSAPGASVSSFSQLPVRFLTPACGSASPASSFFACPEIQPAWYPHWPLCRLVGDL